jgi:protein Tex
VPGVGDATFTQAAGFLKIRDGDEPLDQTWIHPESYEIARQVLARLDAGGATSGLAGDLRERLAALEPETLAAELGVGAPTLRDIIDALARPGRDPRADLPGPIFRSDILKLSDLSEGMELRGTVLNVVDFGAFVDIGLKESGLVHVSRLSSQFVKSPHDVVSVGDLVTVWVLSVDAERKRVSLSMVPPGEELPARGRRARSAAAADKATAELAPTAKASPPVEARPETPRQAPRKPHRHAPAGKPARLSSAALHGEEPLRSFEQLKQFWKKKET